MLDLRGSILEPRYSKPEARSLKLEMNAGSAIPPEAGHETQNMSPKPQTSNLSPPPKVVDEHIFLYLTRTMENDIKFGTDGWRARIADDYTFDNVRRCTQGFAEYLK